VLKICEQGNVNELGLGMVMMALSLVLVAELNSAGVTIIDQTCVILSTMPLEKTCRELCSANLLCDLAVKVVIREGMMILQLAGTVSHIPSAFEFLSTESQTLTDESPQGQSGSACLRLAVSNHVYRAHRDINNQRQVQHHHHVKTAILNSASFLGCHCRHIYRHSNTSYTTSP
jgi:hypothetical protein